MDNATAKLEQELIRAAVETVLLHRIFNCLFGEIVFKLKCRNGQAVNE
jgi:hypothetical protein